MSDRFKCPLSAQIFFIKKGKILLQKRKGKSFPGFFGVPGGHVDGNEKIIDAAIRETKEEVGVSLKEEDLELLTIYHSNFGGNEYIHFFYLCKKVDLYFQNCEPEECEQIGFFELNHLPEKTLGLLEPGLEALKTKTFFKEDPFPFK